MDGKKNNLMGDIYTSYGPFVGKVCENTNIQLHNDNIIESITSSISSKPVTISPIEDGLKRPSNNFVSPIKMTHKTGGNMKIGGDIKKTLDDINISQKNNINDDESTSFFNYKISIYNYKISIWIFLLILLIVICIGYFIYKYWYLKNTSIITYKKTNLDNDKILTEENSLSDDSDSDSESENNTEVSSSSDTTTKSQ